jgi:RNA 3'-terminal phosphate cyclase
MRMLDAAQRDWQFLRQALALGLASGKPLRLSGAGPLLEAEPEYRPAFHDLARACAVTGAGLLELRGDSIVLEPVAVSPGSYAIDIDRYSAAGEVLLFLLPLLCTLDFRTVLTVRGVTHSHIAMPTSYFKECLFSAIERMGLFCSLTLRRFGFHGTGGGLCEARVYPREDAAPGPLYRGERTVERARIFISGMTGNAGGRFREMLCGAAGLAPEQVGLMEVIDADGPGISIDVGCRYGELPLIFSAGGRFYTPAGDFVYEEAQVESAVAGLGDEVRRFIASGFLPERHLRELAAFACVSRDRGLLDRCGLREYAGPLPDLL